MNLTHTAQRNAQNISTVRNLRNLMFIKVNGPPLKQFRADEYASTWIKEGHHSASDKPSGHKAEDEYLQHHCKMFI